MHFIFLLDSSFDVDVQRRMLSYCKLKTIDKPLFRNDLESICQDLLLIDDLNELAAQYNSRLLSLLDKHAPVTSKTLSVHPRVPWFIPLSTILKEVGGKQKGHGEVIWLILFLAQSSRL